MTGHARVKTGTAPRPVFCVIEHVYRNLAVADDVAAGRFTHAGVTVDLGVEPDWLAAALPEDEEWRIEWNKFYYSLNLAHAFCETADQKYLRAWESLIGSWIRQVPVGFDTSDVAGRRIQNWIYAWNLFASAPHFGGLAKGLDEQIITSLTDQVNYLREHLSPERNHRTLELYALFIAALALPQMDPRGELLGYAVDELHHNLLCDVREDGVHRESSTHYHMTALRSFVGARENARRFHLALPDGFDGRLERACEFALHCHRPDGLIPALSDGDTGSYADVLNIAASIFSRPDFLYAATAGADGRPPSQRYASFPDGGYYVQRSGWGDGDDSFRDERFLIFDCGPLGDGGHGHYDLLSVEIAANGRPLIIDPGRYTYSEQGDNWRRWFKGTAAHNTVTVDGLDQTAYRRGKPKGLSAQGRLIERLSAPDFDVLAGDAVSNLYEVVHTRRIFFIAGQYWLIADHLRGERPHRFDLRFHLGPTAQGRVLIETHGDNVLARTPELALAFGAACEVSVQPGWYAPAYGNKLPAPVISAVVDGNPQADFYTLVLPLKASGLTPTLKVDSWPSLPGRSVTFEIGNVGPDAGTSDYVVWSDSHDSLELGGFHCRAAAAWQRRSGKRVSFSACNAREIRRPLKRTGPVLRSDEPIRWLTWDERGGIMLDDGRKL